MGEDRTETGRQRVSVAQAAEILGVTVEAVRGRIKRETLEAEREGDHVFVLLEADQSRPDAGRPADQTQPDALISAKDETTRLLQEQLQAERQGHAEARRLLAAALERIPPQLEAPSEARESPERVEQEPERTESPSLAPPGRRSG